MQNSGNYISISTGSIIRFFLVVIVIAALFYLRDVVLVVLAAVVIASALEPMVRRLGKFHVHRVISAVLIYLIMAGIIAAFVAFFMPLVVSDAVSFLNNLPRTISLSDIWSPIRDFGFSFLPETTSDSISVSTIINGLQSALTGTTAGALHTANFIFGGFFSFALIAVMSFYMVVQEDGVENFIRIVTPSNRHAYAVNLWGRARRKIGSWLQGQILLGLVVGALVYTVLYFLHIPHALLLALLAAGFELIPVFGPVISSVPAILIAFTDIGVGTGLLLVGLYLIIYQFESQLFYPLVVKKIVGISPIIVILALVIGAKLAGILGALIAVPLAAALMEYVNDIEKRKRAETTPTLN